MLYKSRESNRGNLGPENGQAASPDAGNNSGLEPTHTVFEEEIEQSVPDRFEKIVRTYPDRLAVKMGDRALTYDDLNRVANCIAHAILEKRGHGSEPIGLLFEPGVDVITTILGVLKAGKFIVTLNPSFPSERSTCILEDSQAGLIVTNKRNAERAHELTNDTRAILNIDEIDDYPSGDDLGLFQAADNLLAIRYTSGSTGEPKGVVETHRNCLHSVMLHADEMRTCVDDRLSLLHSVSFASAHVNLFQSLLTGASLFPFDVKCEGIHQLV